MEIETARLRFRPFVSDDLDDLCNLYSDAEVMKFLGKGARDRAETEAWLLRAMAHWSANDFGVWSVRVREDGRFAGRCGLQVMPESLGVEVGYVFHREYWGRGFATEGARASLRFGFGKLNLRRIVAIARPANAGSWRVMQKIGMTYERSGPSPYDGSEVVWYAMTRDEFRRQATNEPT